MRKFTLIIALILICGNAFSQYSEIWGATFTGGNHDAGFIFKMNAEGDNYQIMHHFDGVSGGLRPTGALSEGPNGLLYGITRQGGLHNKGVIFSFDPNYNSFNVAYHLEDYLGANLLLASNGRFYSMSSNNLGSIYEFDPIDKSLNLVYDFPDSEGKQSFAENRLILVNDNLIYGTTAAGGSFNKGVLFEYNITSKIYTVKHHFDNTSASNPHNFLVYSNGKIYGTANDGGDFNRGVLYEYNIANNAFTVKQHLESIHTSPTGMNLGPDGKIYIPISIGGTLWGGAICKYDPVNDTLEFVQEWVDEGNPSLPTGSMMSTYNGKIFGSTRYGGTGLGLGVIYEYDIATEKVTIVQNLNDGFPTGMVLTEVGERTVTSITINSLAIEITTDNGTLQLSATLEPVEANNQPVVWSVNSPDVASISSDGLLTAVSNGVVTITAMANYGLGVSTTRDINISNQDETPPVILVNSLEITSATDKITSFGSTLQLNTDVLPINASDKTVTWHVSDNSIATISASGILTALSAGTITVTALVNDGSGKYGTKEIEVINHITSIVLTPSTNTIDTYGGSIDFNAIVLPDDATNKEIEWSLSNSSVGGYINQDGVLTATKNGTVYVIAKSIDGSSTLAEHTVTIINQESGIPVSSITISAVNNSIDTDEGTLQFTASVLPVNATNKTLTWNALPINIVSVDSNGLVTALKNGTVTVVAKSTNNVIGTKTITVTNQPSGPFPLTAINLSPETPTIDVKGGTLQLNAQLVPSDTSDTTLVWMNYNDSVATVSDDGLVTALSDGTVQILTYISTLHSGLIISNSVHITVTNQTDPSILVSSLNITSTSDTIEVKDGSLNLMADILPVDATDKTVTWSVDNPSIASVSPEGVLTALDNGVVTVTATTNDGSGATDSKEITLVNQEDIVLVEVVLVSSPSDEINAVGGTLQFMATVLPSNATDTSVTWTINNNSIATISITGLLTATEDGTLIITATANDDSGVYSSKVITISNQNPDVLATSIAIISNQNFIDVSRGSLTLTTEILPATATVKTVSWSVDDASIATISNTGVLTALDDGTVTVTTTANDGSGISSNKEITISNQDPDILTSSIIINSSQNFIDTAEGSLTLTVEVLPTNAMDKTVSWWVDDGSIASISSSGVLTAVKDGLVTVTASANDGSEAFGSIEVTISNQNFLILTSSLNISSTQNFIDVIEGSLALTTEVLPVNTTIKSISWSVDDTSIASISSSGVLTAINDGIVSVTATVNDGSGASASKTITISNQNTVNTEDVSAPSVVIYPNPASDYVNVQIDDELGIYQIRLYSLTGNLILETSNNVINVQSLSRGIYIIVVWSQRGERRLFKFTKT